MELTEQNAKNMPFLANRCPNSELPFRSDFRLAPGPLISMVDANALLHKTTDHSFNRGCCQGRSTVKAA
jgi:hypothetical protein